MSDDPRPLVPGPASHSYRLAADGLRGAGRARTLAEHAFVHRARDLEALWRA